MLTVLLIFQVTMDNHTCKGVGPNKKLAKRSAAEALLNELGLNKTTPPPGKSSIKHGEVRSLRNNTHIFICY